MKIGSHCAMPPFDWNEQQREREQEHEPEHDRRFSLQERVLVRRVCRRAGNRILGSLHGADRPGQDVVAELAQRRF